MHTPGSSPADRQIDLLSRSRIGLALAGCGLTYAVLGFVGSPFLVYKTFVIPVFAAYALALPESQRASYLRAWLPFLAGTVLFDLIRGAIYQAVLSGWRPIFTTYPITLEQWVFGVQAAPLVFQRASSPFLDVLAVAEHLSHFGYFLAMSLVVWKADPKQGAWLHRALLATMALGLAGYFLVPTLPPWLASDQGFLPPIHHIASDVYRRIAPGIVGMFDTNPVAAMPSIHAAFPTVCAVVGAGIFGGRGRVALWTYAAAMMLAVMYLGEHYAVDLIAGIAVGLVATWGDTPQNLVIG